VLGQTEEVSARDDEPVLLGEPVDGVQQQIATLEPEDSRLGGRGRVPRADLPRGTQRERIATPRGTPTVARLVRDDGEEPWSKRLAAAKPAERAERLYEAVLRRFFRIRDRPRDQVGDLECDSLVHPYELLVGGDVASLRAGNELRLFEWPAHHHASSTPAREPQFRRLSRRLHPRNGGGGCGV